MKIFQPRNLTNRQAAMPLILWLVSVFTGTAGSFIGGIVAGERGFIAAVALMMMIFGAAAIVQIWCLLVDDEMRKIVLPWR